MAANDYPHTGTRGARWEASMIGTPDSSDHRKAWWRAQVDRLLEMTRLVPRPPRTPPTEPIHRDAIETPTGSPQVLHEQRHVNPQRADEHRHEDQ